jgi:hypothetical protein
MLDEVSTLLSELKSKNYPKPVYDIYFSIYTTIIEEYGEKINSYSSKIVLGTNQNLNG